MSDEKINPTRLVGLAALAALLIGCFLVLRPFLSALLWAAILAFVTWPAYRFLVDRARLPPGWAAGVMVAVMMLLVGVPLVLVAPTSREEVDGIRSTVEGLAADGPARLVEMLGRLPLIGEYLRDFLGNLDLGIGNLFNMVRPYIGSVAQTALGFVLALLSGLAEFLLAIALSFFFYKDGPRLAAALDGMCTRIAGQRGRDLLTLTGNVTQGVVYGLLGTAVVQGVMTGLGFWLAGVPSPLLFGVIAGAISILPVGAPLVWIPATIYLLVNGSTAWGIFMGLYGFFGISSVDNFIRPWLISRGADLPLLLTILGALGGAIAFGLLGLFLGPVVLAVAYTVVKEWSGAGRGRAVPPPVG